MRRSLALAAVLALSACAARPTPLALAPAPAPIPALAFVPAAPTLGLINRDLSPAATVWHVRAALNVAALACRGQQGEAIVARYNALLGEQKAPLAAAQAALAAEFRAAGGNWQDRYDDAMTRLYNYFSQSQARERFCAAAADVLAETATLAPEVLATFAARRLPALDAPFAAPPLPTPVIAVSAPVPQASAEPKLAIDVAALN